MSSHPPVSSLIEFAKPIQSGSTAWHGTLATWLARPTQVISDFLQTPDEPHGADGETDPGQINQILLRHGWYSRTSELSDWRDWTCES